MYSSFRLHYSRHVSKIKGKIEEKAFGYDAYKNEFCDMIACGIVDPTKVTRSAIENAASVAATLLTTEALVAEIEDKKENTSHADY